MLERGEVIRSARQYNGKSARRYAGTYVKPDRVLCRLLPSGGGTAEGDQNCLTPAPAPILPRLPRMFSTCR